MLTFLFCLPVFLLAQRPVSVRTDAGQGTKQEQRDPAASRPTAPETTTPTRRTPTRPAPAPPTTRSGSEAECPPGGWGQNPPRTTTRNDRPTQTSRSRTSTTGNRPASTRPPRTTTTSSRTRTNQGDWSPPGRGQTSQRTTECDQRPASTRPHPADCTCQEKGKKGRGWANGHQKKANPNARALRIPSVPAHGRKNIATGGFAGSNKL